MKTAIKDMSEDQVAQLKFKWVVEFEVSGTWVADGFNLTDERAKDMLAHDLQYAYGCELKAKVIKAPEPLDIAYAQGYEDDKSVLKVIEDGTINED